MKEVIIIIFVIIIVVVMGNITQNYLKETSNEILTKLTNLKTEIKEIKENNNNIDSINKEIEKIIARWEINKNWSKVIVHEELDNIKLSLLELKACIETTELQDSLKEIDKLMFLIGHIEEKESFRIKNIF